MERLDCWVTFEASLKDFQSLKRQCRLFLPKSRITNLPIIPGHLSHPLGLSSPPASPPCSCPMQSVTNLSIGVWFSSAFQVSLPDSQSAPGIATRTGQASSCKKSSDRLLTLLNQECPYGPRPGLTLSSSLTSLMLFLCGKCPMASLEAVTQKQIQGVSMHGLFSPLFS